ncbi:hypothetical protein Sjap_023997 [Stephania japonica]|uniref:Uncharacterized protein n=1 Tax=Stephania japonica TaxID=461633 RepID=A0AAP0ECN5_9MAGN
MDRDEAIQLLTWALVVEEGVATKHVNKDLKVSKPWLKVIWDPCSSIRSSDEDIAEVIFYIEIIKYIGIVEPYHPARYLR